MSWTELHPFIQEAGRTTLAVGILVLLVLAIRRPFARRFGAKAAYALWMLPLVRFVMPPLPSNWSLAGWLGQLSASPAQANHLPIILNADRAALFRAPPAAPVDPAHIELAPAALLNSNLLEGTLAHTPLILTTVWMAGVLLWLGRAFYQQRQFLQLIRDDSVEASPQILSKANLIAQQVGLKRVPDIRASLLCSGPLVTGLKTPVVLLPLWFEEDYSRNEQRDALIHELIHLRRRDLWAFQVARIVTATQWFNPLAYMALNAFRTDQESACDADVLAQADVSPAAYGRTLVKAARLAHTSDRRIAAASLTLAHPIKERLIMMQHPNPTLRSRLMGTALVVALGSAAIFTTASCTTAQADEPETRTFVFKSGDGSSDNRQMVLLGDPFAMLQPKLAAIGDMDFGDMQIDLDFEMEELDLDIADLMESLGGLESMEEMGRLGEMLSFEMTGEDGQNVFIMKLGESSQDFEVRIEEWSERFEERAEEFEARAEEWAERYEDRVEQHSDEIDRRTHAITIRIERRADAIAEAHEGRAEAFAARIESAFGESFEAQMESAGQAVESLSEQCNSRDEDDPTPEIVSATNEETGDTFQALCVNGDRDVLKSQGLIDWVQARTDLSDEEKAMFMDNRNRVHTFRIDIDRSDHDADEHPVHRRIIRRSERTVTEDLDGGDEE